MDYGGELHVLGGKAKEVWLGHLNTCTGKMDRLGEQYPAPGSGGSDSD